MKLRNNLDRVVGLCQPDYAGRMVQNLAEEDIFDISIRVPQLRWSLPGGFFHKPRQ